MGSNAFDKKRADGKLAGGKDGRRVGKTLATTGQLTSAKKTIDNGPRRLAAWRLWKQIFGDDE